MSEKVVRRAGPKWTGLGFWNVFFIGEFILGAAGYLQLNLLQNCILVAFVLFPISNRWLSALRTLIAVCAAVALVYSESWLPGIESIKGNFHNIVAMDSSYVLESAFNFINFEMIGGVLLLIVLYYALKDYVRITTFTLAYLLILICAPLWQPLFEKPEPAVVTVVAPKDAKADVQEAEPAPSNGLLPQTAKPTNAALDEWLKAFHEKERSRKIDFPDKLAKDDTPFDILLINICSLSNADLKAVSLAEHPLFKQFNVIFTNFNSATSYSGPAALRLLKSVCGQPSHEDLYEARNPDCELMNRLGRLGYSQHVFMDHSGTYDNFYQSLRHLAGLTPQLTQPMKYPKRYDSFDEEPIGDARAVFKDWLATVGKDDNARSASFFNLIALHDGNRFANKRPLAAFKPRAKAMFDDLEGFIKEIQNSGRKAMLIIVPEHGAAEVGDKVQVAKLRDIPSPSITNVPVLVKFIGIDDTSQVVIDKPSSYLAISDLIAKALVTNYFSADKGSVPLQELTANLPQTEAVSENANAKVVRYQDKDYVKIDKAAWREYAK